MASIIMAQVIIAFVTAAALWMVSRRQGPNHPRRIWRVVALAIFVAANLQAHASAIASPWPGLAGPLLVLVSGAVVTVLVWMRGLGPSRPL